MMDIVKADTVTELITASKPLFNAMPSKFNNREFEVIYWKVSNT